MGEHTRAGTKDFAKKAVKKPHFFVKTRLKLKKREEAVLVASVREIKADLETQLKAKGADTPTFKAMSPLRKSNPRAEKRTASWRLWLRSSYRTDWNRTSSSGPGTWACIPTDKTAPGRKILARCCFIFKKAIDIYTLNVYNIIKGRKGESAKNEAAGLDKET